MAQSRLEMVARLKNRAQNSRPYAGRHEVQGFDWSRLPFALLSGANLVPLRGNIRGYSRVTPSASTRSPRYCLALILHFPRLHIGFPSKLPGLYLASSAIPHSAIRIPHSPLGVRHKHTEYNSPPAASSGWSGGALVPPWTYPGPIEPAKNPIFNQPSLSNSLACGFSAAERFKREVDLGRPMHGVSGSVDLAALSSAFGWLCPFLAAS